MYNGFLGGIGQGLQAFTSAYQTALNYQLEKSKAAALTDYQQKMADAASLNAATGVQHEQDEAKYTQALGSAAGQNAQTERAKARTEAMNLAPGSPDFMKAYFPDLMDKSTLDAMDAEKASQDQPPAQATPIDQETKGPISSPSVPPQGLINALPMTGRGSIGPQPSPDMIAASQARAAQLPLVGPPAPAGLNSQMGPQGPSPQVSSARLPSQRPGMLPTWTPSYLRAAYIDAQKRAGEMTAESQAKGENIVYGVNPNNPAQIQMVSQGKKTGDALLSQQTKLAELNNANSGNRSAQETGQKEFNANPSVAAARQSKVYMDQMLQSYNDPSPQAQASLFLNALRIKFPTAPDVGSLEELSKSESAPVQMRNAASKYINGTMDQQQVNDLVRDGISTYQANMKGFRSAQKDYQDKLVNQYGQSAQQASRMAHDSGIDETDSNVIALKSKLGPYKKPSEQGGLLSPVYGLINKVIGNAPVTSSASSQMSIQEQAQAEMARRKAAKK